MLKMLLAALAIVMTGCATVGDHRALRRAAMVEDRIVPPPGTPRSEVESVFGKGAPKRVKGFGVTYYVYPTRHPVSLEVMYDSDKRVERAYFDLHESWINSRSTGQIELLDDPSKELSILEKIDTVFPNRPWNKRALTNL